MKIFLTFLTLRLCYSRLQSLIHELELVLHEGLDQRELKLCLATVKRLKFRALQTHATAPTRKKFRRHGLGASMFTQYRHWTTNAAQFFVLFKSRQAIGCEYLQMTAPESYLDFAASRKQVLMRTGITSLSRFQTINQSKAAYIIY